MEWIVVILGITVLVCCLRKSEGPPPTPIYYMEDGLVYRCGEREFSDPGFKKRVKEGWRSHLHEPDPRTTQSVPHDAAR